jgi:serine/threonine-protein kinase RsbW
MHAVTIRHSQGGQAGLSHAVERVPGSGSQRLTMSEVQSHDTPCYGSAFSVAINGDLAGVVSLSAWILGAATQLGFAPSLIFSLQLCAEELVTNAIQHGRPDARDDFAIRVRICPTPPRLIVEDNGTPFDPTQVIAPPRPMNLEQAAPGGHGLTLVRHFCDVLAYSRKDNWNRAELTFNGDEPITAPQPE